MTMMCDLFGIVYGVYLGVFRMSATDSRTEVIAGFLVLHISWE